MRLPGTRVRTLGLVAVLGAGLAAGCSSGGSGAKSTTPPLSAVPSIGRAATRIAATPKQAAVALGRQMLGEAKLPAGARESGAAPPAVLRGPSSRPRFGNLVFAHRIFTVDKSPYAVWRWLQVFRPRGFVKGTVGSGTTRGVPSWSVEDDLKVLPINISDAELQFGVAGAKAVPAVTKAGPAVIRVDTVVGWTAPRPLSEFVPASDRVVTVTGFHPYAPGSPDGRHVTTSDPKLVAPIVLTFDQLRVEPPNDVHGCPELGSRSVGYRVAFAKSRGAVPDVVATLGPCGGIGVKVSGRAAPSLNWIGDEPFANAVVKVLGLSEPHFN